MAKVRFDTTEPDGRAISAIVKRAVEMGLGPSLDIHMDLSATHCNGNPLRLDALLAADDFNFLHDVCGIARHLDRDTGKLIGHFSPRFSAPSKVSA